MNNNIENSFKIETKNLITIKTRKINNIYIVIKKNILNSINYISITNLNNNQTLVGRSKNNNQLYLLYKALSLYGNVQRDITLFYRLGDQIKLFDSYNKDLIFTLTKINKKTAVFTLNQMKIIVDREVSTGRIKNISKKETIKNQGRMYCIFNKVKIENISKSILHITPIKEDAHYRKYL